MPRRRSANHPVQPAHRWVRWTKAMREGFLDHLAATCNVHESAAAIGIGKACVYRLRRRDPTFAAQWNDALALGYQMLETMVVGHVLAGKHGGDIMGGTDDAPTSVDMTVALKLLTTHRNATGKPHKGGVGRQFARPEDTDQRLMRKLRQIELRRARDAQPAAASREADSDA